MKENFNLLFKIVSRISIRSWEEWVEGFSNLFNKILYDLKPGTLCNLWRNITLVYYGSATDGFLIILHKFMQSDTN